jgi:hypothetical protein
MSSRNSRITGIPDNVRLALTEAADHPDGWFAPGVAGATLGWIRRHGYGRIWRATGNWTILPAGREALARAELALRRAAG